MPHSRTFPFLCMNSSMLKPSAVVASKGDHHVLAGRPHNDVIWIFGFGSLISHPNFAYVERVEGYVKGWRRVFHQGSTDHRGTPEAPGRTVTLIEDAACITWGAAYRLAGTPEEQQETLKYLEWREKQYDLRYRSDVFGKESDSRPLVQGALIYIATPDGTKNVNWLGAAPLTEVAQQIAHAYGPSGPNSEYLYRLADTMRKMEVDDASLFELEAAVRAISKASATQNLDNGKSQGTASEIHSLGLSQS